MLTFRRIKFAGFQFSRGPKFVGGLLLTLLAILTGCNSEQAKPQANGQNGTATVAREPEKAQKILDQMIHAYRNAKSYADVGKLVVTSKVKDQIIKKSYDCSTTFARPNKIRLQAYDVTFICDGKQLHSVLTTLPNQILQLTAPDTMNYLTLSADPIVADSLNGPGGAPMLPLLLTSQDFAKEVLPGTQPPSLGDPEKIGSDMCDRVEVEFSSKTPDKSQETADLQAVSVGKLVFFIDQKNKVLRRLSIPVPAEMAEFYKSRGETDVTIITEFEAAQLNPTDKDEAFAFAMPKDARPVKRFVNSFPPPPPSELLGKRIGDFVLYATDGSKITRESLAGKIAVLDFWRADCQPCQQLLPLVREVADNFKQNDRVVFYAVSAGDAQTNDELQKLLATWGGALPLARDRNDQAAKVFGESGLPFRMILGPDGIVQDYEAGGNPYLVRQLTETINKALAGENTIADVRKRYEFAQKNYDETLTRANEGVLTIQELPKAEIAKATTPSLLKLTKLWNATDLKGSVGNPLIVLRENGSPQIFAVENSRNVVELDSAGKVLTRHNLPIPNEMAVSYLRTAVNGKGQRYFAAFANNMNQCYVFDDAWKLILAYPEGERLGIADVQLVDLEGQGELMLVVGFWDTAGVQGVSLAGKRLWVNRNLQNILSMGISPKNSSGQRHVWCVNGNESLGVLNAEGHLENPFNFNGTALISLLPADLDGSGKSTVCAISDHDRSSTLVVGFDENLHEQWSYPIPKAIPQLPAERIVTGKFANGRGAWLIPGPDGSIHLLASDGKRIDSFSYGADLAGLALTVMDGKTVLLVASKQGLEALEVTGGPSTSAASENITSREKSEERNEK